MGLMGAAMDRDRGNGSGAAKRRPAGRRLLPCWLKRPIPPAASCSADLTGTSARKGELKQWKSNSGTEHGDGEEGRYQALSAKSLRRLRA